jgi:hypothetical protein
MAITKEQIAEVTKAAYANMEANQKAFKEWASNPNRISSERPTRNARASVETEDGTLTLWLNVEAGIASRRNSIIDNYLLNGEKIAKAEIAKIGK